MGTVISALPTIRQLAAALADRRITAPDLVEARLAAAERTNPVLRGFITIAGDSARRQAALSDQRRRQGKALGILDGIPWAAKDLFETAGIRTTGGSRVLADWIPESSAAAVTRLDRLGAVLVGKTNLHEFAYGATGENAWAGTAANPHDPTCLAGGSSGGSAAAVAAGLVPFALGTDTGGSVRVPAALCGVAGYKPTMGKISLQGVIPFCWSLDHAGIIAGSADDLAVLADALAGIAEPAIEAAAQTRAWRIGIVPGWAERCAPAVRHGFEAACRILADLGASFHDVVLPDQAEARTVSLTIQLAEALAYHGPNLRRAGTSFGADIRSGFVLGQFLSAESYVQCKRLVACYAREFGATFDAVDAILTPACPVTAPPIGTTYLAVGGAELPVGNALTLFTSFFNLVGAPAIALRAGADQDGLPVSIQLVGSPHDDARVLGLCLLLERQGLGQVTSGPPPDAAEAGGRVERLFTRSPLS